MDVFKLRQHGPFLNQLNSLMRLAQLLYFTQMQHIPDDVLTVNLLTFLTVFGRPAEQTCREMNHIKYIKI